MGVPPKGRGKKSDSGRFRGTAGAWYGSDIVELNLRGFKEYVES
jgi:hypothetical protein